MIAKAKYIPKRSVLVYRGFDSAKSEGNPMDNIIRALRNDSGYKVIEVYVERASLANHFDMVLCDLDAPLPENHKQRETFYKNLKKVARESKIPFYINPSQDKSEEINPLERLAELGISLEPEIDTIAA